MRLSYLLCCCALLAAPSTGRPATIANLLDEHRKLQQVSIGSPITTGGALGGIGTPSGLLGNGGSGVQNAASAYMAASNVFQSVPVSELVAGVQTLKDSGYFKRIGVGRSDPSLKAQSLPPSGLTAPKSQCFQPAKAKDGTVDGGMTCCIAADALKKDQSKPQNSPYIGGVQQSECRATIKGKNAAFNGYYCATVRYEGSDCPVSKYQPAPDSVTYEVVLQHNEAVNDVVCRCTIKDGGDGLALIDNEALWQVDPQSVKPTTDTTTPSDLGSAPLESQSSSGTQTSNTQAKEDRAKRVAGGLAFADQALRIFAGNTQTNGAVALP